MLATSGTPIQRDLSGRESMSSTIINGTWKSEIAQTLDIMTTSGFPQSVDTSSRWQQGQKHIQRQTEQSHNGLHDVKRRSEGK